MTPFPWSDVFLIAGLILLNGLFSMSELAIVSARPARLKVAADRGSKGAIAALALAADPGKFLSTVQIGITMVGIIAGAYSGASLGGPTGERMALLGVPARYADDAGAYARDHAREGGAILAVATIAAAIGAAVLESRRPDSRVRRIVRF